MFRSSSISVALIASVAFAACGGDPEPVPEEETATVAKSTPTTTGGDVSRYCSLTRDLDAAGEKFFSQLEGNAGPEEFAAAERRFVRRFGGELEAIQESAPTSIRSDVATLVAAMRQRGGLETATKVGDNEASAAEARIKAYERRNCTS